VLLDSLVLLARSVLDTLVDIPVQQEDTQAGDWLRAHDA
jgi:hypothetical protein